MKAYSMDLRERVLADCDASMPTKSVAAKYRVSPAWVRRLKQRRRETGETAPRPPRNRRIPKLTPHLDRIKELLDKTPDMTLPELRAELKVTAALSTLWHAVNKLHFTVKKKSSAPRSRTGRT